MTTHKNFYKVSKSNTEIINEYLQYKKTSKVITERSLRNIKETLKKLADFLKQKSIKKADKEDLIGFFGDEKRVKIKSRDTYANHIIPFFRWVNDLDKHTRPDNMKWFEYTTQRDKRKQTDPNRKEKFLISRDEYEKMLSYVHDPFGQNNALWETYYLSGARPEELLKMKVRDLKIGNDSVSITITDSKTIPRQIPLSENPINLIKYFECHPNKNNPDAPLWFSFKNINNQLKGDAVRNRFREMVKKINLKETFSIKCFRKARATIMFQDKEFDDTYIGMFFGWTPQTVIMRRQEYNLTNYEDLKNKVCKIPYRAETYDTLKKEKEQLKNKYDGQIKFLEEELSGLKDQLVKKTEIDSFVMDTLSLLAREMMQKQGIEGIKEIFKKHNVPLARD